MSLGDPAQLVQLEHRQTATLSRVQGVLKDAFSDCARVVRLFSR